MIAVLRIPLVMFSAILLATSGFTSAAQTGCLTIRNDSSRMVVVQETVIHNGQLKRLRPIRLLPGESVRQADSTAGNRSFEVFDGQSPTRPLWSGKLWIGDGNRTIAVSNDAKGLALQEVPASSTPTRRK